MLAHDFPIDPRYSNLDHLDRAFAELRRLTKINCWHRADYESDAMWTIISFTIFYWESIMAISDHLGL